MNKINLNLLVFYFFFLILATFFIEVIYKLPSPNADGSQFLKLALNICRYDTFTTSGSELGNKFVHHGWIPYYLKSLLSIDCNFHYFFIFNFLVKLITTFFSYLFLKKKINNFYIIIILSLIFTIQLKLQFRPETFALMLSSIIIFFHDNKNYKLVALFFGILFYTHLIFFCFLGLFFVIYFYKIYFNLRIFLHSSLIFILTLFLLDLIYPYNITDYLKGIFFGNSATWKIGGGGFSLPLFIDYYIITIVHGGGVLPLWGILFFFIILILLKQNKLMCLTLPFIYYFSLRNIPGNYYMIGITPILIFLIFFIKDKDYFYKSKVIKSFFLLILVVSILGNAHYFGRNILTIKYFKNDLRDTTNFINNNLEEIDQFPSFGFYLNKKIKLEDYDLKGCQNCNASRLKEKKYNLMSTNGSLNPCPDSNLNLKDFSIRILGKKIFNSNSGYGVYICKIK